MRRTTRLILTLLLPLAPLTLLALNSATQIQQAVTHGAATEPNLPASATLTCNPDWHTAVATTDTVPPDTLPASTPRDGNALSTQQADNGIDTTSILIVNRLSRLLENPIFKRTQVGIYVYDLTADKPLFAHGEEQQLRPASNEKLITAISALTFLGTDYRYETKLFTDGEVKDSVLKGDIILRGGFDPLIDRDDLRAFADSMRAAGIEKVDGELLFDRSFKDTATLGWGWCWDDDETPLSPLLYNGKPGLADRLASFLNDEGMGIKDTPREISAVPPTASLLAVRTHTIDQILMPMMKRSDNLFAESLFYQIAAKGGRRRASRKHAAKQINQLISRLGLNPSAYQIADGSGLSLYNYLSPRLLVTMLRHAYRDEAVYRHLLPSLPIAGEDGTLRRRMRGSSARGNVKAKTGTVEGVSTLSGYATATNGHVLCFSIMNQGIRYTATGRRFQDRVCDALTGTEVKHEPGDDEDKPEAEIEKKGNGESDSAEGEKETVEGKQEKEGEANVETEAE